MTDAQPDSPPPGRRPATGRARRGPTAPVVARPLGLGVAVVFDWALAAQFATQAVAGATGHLGQPRTPGAVAGLLVGAAVLTVAGQGLRRGVPLMRIVQVILCGILTVGGALLDAALVSGHGSRALIINAIVQSTAAPFIVARLLDPRTAAWFRQARGHGTPPRLSGRWVGALVAWSIAWGVFVAWAQSL